ncbi:MAG: SH3 domain-containing protein, partial [Chloroflexota bacterium]
TIAALDENVQGGFFNFTGNEGDFIMVEAVALSGSLDPRITLLNAASTTLAVNANDPFQPGIGDARLTYRVPTTSSYTLLVEAENGTAGQYLLRLERLEVPTPTELGAGVITTATVSPDFPAQVYSFDSALGTSLSVTSTQPGFEYVAEVYTPEGRAIAIQNGAVLDRNVTTVPANTGIYTLIVRAGTASASGSADIEFGASAPTDLAAAPPADDAAAPPADSGDEVAAPPADDTTTLPTSTPAPETTTTDADADTDTDTADAGDEGTIGAASTDGGAFPTNRCNVSPQAGGVVIRQGPDTSFPAIASIPQGEFRFAQATDGAWIQLVGEGWVSSGVVDLNGPCGALPLISAATSPQAAAEEAAPQPEPTTVAPVGSR